MSDTWENYTAEICKRFGVPAELLKAGSSAELLGRDPKAHERWQKLIKALSGRPSTGGTEA